MDFEKLKFWKQNRKPEEPNITEESTPETRELAKKTENAQAQASKVIERLNEGDIDKACSVFTRNFFGKKYDEETQVLIENRVIPYAREKIIKAIVNGRGDELVQMIGRFHGYSRNGREKVDFIKPEDLEQIPEDILKSPEIVEKIHIYLIDRFRCAPNIFDYELKLYSNLGFITPEEIIKLPEIKEVARSLLLQSPTEIRYSSSPTGDLRRLFKENTFDELKKVILELGILSEAEIEQIRLNK